MDDRITVGELTRWLSQLPDDAPVSCLVEDDDGLYAVYEFKELIERRIGPDITPPRDLGAVLGPPPHRNSHVYIAVQS